MDKFLIVTNRDKDKGLQVTGFIQKYLEENGFEIFSAEFERIPTDTKELSAEQKESVKQYYLAREAVAKRFNVPSFHVMDKRELLQFSLSCPSSKEAVLAFARKAGPRFRTQLQESLLQAFDIIHAQD